ncbi:MAG: Gfo/Idh/MocA family oxidoreductase [Nanoarchaeota archaeon]
MITAIAESQFAPRSVENKKLKVGVIGLGKQSCTNHIPVFGDSPSAELVAICDVNKERLEEIAKTTGARQYADYLQLLEAEEVDFVLISTPHDIYPKVIEEAAKRKVHILKEKPLARTIGEAKSLEEICNRNKVHLSVMTQRRFNPVYQNYFLLKSQIGEISSVDSRYTLGIEEPNGGWRGDRKKAGGGCIMDMGYHMIDLIIWYLGLPDKVHAEFSFPPSQKRPNDIEDTATILFSYNGGAHGSLFLSRRAAPKTEYIKIVGSEGTIEIQKNSIKSMDKKGRVLTSLVQEQICQSISLAQIEYFCSIVRGEAENNGNPTYHLQHIGLIEACYCSKESGGYVSPFDLLRTHGT